MNMTKREQMIECMNVMQEGMEKTQICGRTIWFGGYARLFICHWKNVQMHMEEE